MFFKENVKVKHGDNDIKAYCDYCDMMFFNNKGLKIHIGKMHTANAAPLDPPSGKIEM